jgi:RNA polymerase sigma-70 factor (ECF subfamily)
MEPTFAELIGQIRQGNAAAATDLVRLYEPEIRRAIRIRLTDDRIRRVIDSMDICQSVMANFFARVSQGQFDIQEPPQLLRLLVTMARNRLLDHVRHEQAERRDRRRMMAGDSALARMTAAVDSPSQIVAGRELIDEMRRRFTAEERYLAEQRASGRDWSDLASELGKQPDALRKQLARAVDRVMDELGLDSDDGLPES